MMLDRATAIHFAKALAEKAKFNDINWTFTQDGAYCIALPELYVIFRTNPDLTEDKHITMEIASGSGQAIGAINVRQNEREYSLFSELLRSADNFANQWNSQIEKATESIEQSTGKIGMSESSSMTLATTATPPPPPPPILPNDEDAAKFFSKISGNWFLDYSRGTENLTIDSSGNYFVHSKNTPVGGKLHFRLLLISSDLPQKHVELAKQELSGKIRQIEVLDVSHDALEGYAKHDGHRVRYRRT